MLLEELATELKNNPKKVITVSTDKGTKLITKQGYLKLTEGGTTVEDTLKALAKAYNTASLVIVLYRPNGASFYKQDTTTITIKGNTLGTTEAPKYGLPTPQKSTTFNNSNTNMENKEAQFYQYQIGTLEKANDRLVSINDKLADEKDALKDKIKELETKLSIADAQAAIEIQKIQFDKSNTLGGLGEKITSPAFIETIINGIATIKNGNSSANNNAAELPSGTPHGALIKDIVELLKSVDNENIITNIAHAVTQMAIDTTGKKATVLAFIASDPNNQATIDQMFAKLNTPTQNPS